MTLPLVYHPDYGRIQMRLNHQTRMSKYASLADRLRDLGLMRQVLAPGEASLQLISRVHEISYVERVFNTSLTDAELRDIGVPNTPVVARRSRLAVMGTLLAARLALQHGMAANLAGGSHHAGPRAGRGFCVFNDVAVAATDLLASGDVGRVLVIDLDVHQGDGTAEIFAKERRVFTFSLHAGRNYPIRKIPSDLDIALADGTNDRTYLAALSAGLRALETRFSPDLVFYNAGVDPHQNDRLGRLALSDEGLRARDSMVMAWCRAQALPLALVLGGGYSHDPKELAQRHAILFEEAQALIDTGNSRARMA